MSSAQRKDADVIVVGAGIIGVSVAMELQQRKFKVLLIDRKEPGEETSFGNAGIISRFSALPLNAPMLWRKLPIYTTNTQNALRYQRGYVTKNWRWFLHFLKESRRSSFRRRMHSLDGLISRSYAQHKVWVKEANMGAQFRENGILKVYRKQHSFDASVAEQRCYDDLKIGYQVIPGEALSDIEPALRLPAYKALLIDGASVKNPGKMVKGYVKKFEEKSGRVKKLELENLVPSQEHWSINTKQGVTLRASRIVVCMGPWSLSVADSLGLSMPMVWERGTHCEYDFLEEEPRLERPASDVEGGYYITPQEDTLRMTTGIHLSSMHAPMPFDQQEACERKLRSYMNLRPAAVSKWQGARPSMPDMLPLIGPSKLNGLWFATGHQHIGFMTGPATGELIAQLMTHKTPTLADFKYFAPARYAL